MLEDLPRIEAWTGIGAAFCAVANRRLLHPGPARPEPRRRHRLLVLAGRDPPRLPGLRDRRVPRGAGRRRQHHGGPGPDAWSWTRPVPSRRTGAASPSTRPPTATAAARAPVSSCSSGSPTPGATATASSPCITRHRRQPGRPYQRHHGAELRGPGPPRCARPTAVPVWTRSTVDYIEAHGTGTRAGDPIETTAMAEVFGAGRAADQPCPDRLGEAQHRPPGGRGGRGGPDQGRAGPAPRAHSAAGQLPHAQPGHRLGGSRLKVVAEPTPWPVTGRPRRAGVSGYGYGGTIAPHRPGAGPRGRGGGPRRAPTRPPRTAYACSRCRVRPRRAARPSGGPRRLAGCRGGARTAARRRRPHPGRAPAATPPSRAVAAAPDAAQLATRLRAFAAGEGEDGIETGTVLSGAARGAVWVFSGHGSQWVGMGRELLAEEADVRQGARRDRPHLPGRDRLLAPPGAARRRPHRRRQDPADDLRHAGRSGRRLARARPGARPPSSATRWARSPPRSSAGILSLADGARLICRRSALLQPGRGQGRHDHGRAALRRGRRTASRGRTDVTAAISASPGSTVVAGDTDAVEELAAGLARPSRSSVRRVASDVAFHSPHMDPLLAELSAAARRLDHRGARAPALQHHARRPARRHPA